MAGDEHEIICNATTMQGIQSFPNLRWLNNSNGEILQSFVHDDIDVGPIRTQGKSVLLPLKFNVLRAEHSANYTCQATLPLLPLSTDLSLNATHFVDVYSEASYSVFQYCFYLFSVSLALLAAYELNTTIISSRPDNTYSAATDLSLECQVSCGIGGYSYQWSSDCTGDCFIASQNASLVSRSALHSTDSGNHTCIVVDGVGNMGSETMSINVVGE